MVITLLFFRKTAPPPSSFLRLSPKAKLKIFGSPPKDLKGISLLTAHFVTTQNKIKSACEKYNRWNYHIKTEMNNTLSKNWQMTLLGQDKPRIVIIVKVEDAVTALEVQFFDCTNGTKSR